MVTEVAEAYWHALRWDYPEKATQFVEEGEGRIALWDYLLGNRGAASLNETSVYEVVMDEEGKKATVLVTYQLLRPDAASIETRRVRQSWYVKNGHWFLELKQDELTRLSPMD